MFKNLRFGNLFIAKGRKPRLVLLSIAAVAISSCHKFWNCNVPYAELLCVKGTDTIHAFGYISPVGAGPIYNYSQSYFDSMNSYYKQRGYLIDTLSDGATISTTDPVQVKAYEADGAGCEELFGF